METIMTVILLLIWLIAMTGIMANYVLQSLATMNLASSRGVENPWLAWLPVGNVWVLGAILDKLESLKGVSRKWRKLLLVLYLIFFVAYFAFFFFMIVFSIALAATDSDNVAGSVITVVFLYLFMIAMMLVMMALSLLTTICLYKIYEELAFCKAIKYVLISTLVPFGTAYCLAKCRESSVGLPPPPQYPYAAPPTTPENFAQPADPQNPAFGYDPAAAAEEPKEQ